MTLNDLLVRIDASTEQLRRELKAAENQTAATTAKIDSKLATIDRAFDRLNAGAKRVSAAIGVAVGALAVRQISGFIGKQIEAADAIGETADAAGLGAEQMQRLMFAFTDITNATKGQAEKALQTFNVNLGKARDGSKELQEAFKELGVDLTQNADVALPQTFEGLSKIDDAGRRAALAAEVLGDRFGPKLAGALNGSTKALYDSAAAAKGILTDENIKKASELNSKFMQLQGVLTAEFASTILDNADAMQKLAIASASFAGVAASSTGSVIDFVHWLGEEMAARIHGVADNDVPRLTIALRDAQKELARLQSPNFKGIPVGRIAEAQAEVDRLTEALRRAQEMSRGLPGASAGDGKGNKPPPNVVTPPKDTAAANAALKEEEERQQRLIDLLGVSLDEQRSMQDHYDAGVKAKRQQQDEEDQRLWGNWMTRHEEQRKKVDEISTAIQANLGGAVDDLFSSGQLSADAFFESILRDIARVTAQLLIVKPLMAGLFGAGAGGAGGGLFGAVTSGIGALFGGSTLPGFAKGGEFTVPGTGPADSVFAPMMLSPQEQVSITPKGQSRGNVVHIHNNVNVGAGASRAEVASAMKVASDHAVARVYDAMRRGR